MDEKENPITPIDVELDVDGTLPHQIHSPDYKQSSRQIEPPFVNEFGVVIGDSFYESPQSPLQQWSTDTDPAVMAGDRWVHPTNDIGWNSTENREIAEDQPTPPKGAPFMHPTLDAGYGRD